MDDVNTEFRRIGFAPEALGVLPFSGTREALLALLLTVPSGIGLDAFHAYVRKADPDALSHGPLLWIRFVADADAHDIDSMLSALRQDLPPRTGLWFCEPCPAGRTGAVNFRSDTDPNVVAALVELLLEHELVADVHVCSGNAEGPPWPRGVHEDVEDQLGGW